MHKFRTILSVVATAAMVLGTMGVASAAAASNETRADFIVQLDQSLGIQPVTPTTPDFSDVPSTNADYGYIEAAYQKGFINGIAKGLFGPTLPVTRAEAAKILVEAYEGGNYTPTQTSTTFTDNASIPTALVGYVAEANSLKLMLGFTSGSFGPEAYLTTAQETHLIAQLKAVQVAAGFKVTASATDVAPGQTVTLTSSVPNATFAVTTAPSGATYALSGNLFSATTAGNYVITGTVDGTTATAAVTVYGAPASVVLTGSKTIVADGDSGPGDGAENTITATVEDANGNTVANFNGNVTLYDTANMSEILTSSDLLQSSYTASASNGVATFTVESTGITAGLSDTLTATATDVTGTAVGQGTFTLTSVAPTASALSLSASPASIDVNSLNAMSSLSISVTDAAGDTFSGVPEQVTLSLSGPGSFTALSASNATATTTETLYVNGSLSIPVYGVEGQTGTINVTASASGLTSGSVKIPAVISGVPAKLGVTSATGTTAGGVPYTTYTVQLEDASGNPITSGTGANDNITISDNEGSLGGTLTYWAVSNGAPTGNNALVSSGTNLSEQLSAGSYKFAVETSGTTSTAPTITIDDTSENFTTTVAYSYQVGTATNVLFETGGNTYKSLLGLTAPTLYAETGTSVTLSAQITDASGNAVAKAGQTIDFAFVSNSAGATMPIGNAVGVDYAVPTNAQGIASVTINTGNAGTFQLEAGLPGNALVAGPTVEVAAPSTGSVTGMKVGWDGNASASVPSSISSGATNTSFEVQLVNPLGGPVTTEQDSLLISSSSSSILNLPNVPNSGVVATSSGALAEAVTGGLAGTATVTFTDLTNLNVAPVTETISVAAGTNASSATFYYNGLPISSGNPVSVTANVPVLLQVESTDAGGNPVTETSNTTFNLSPGTVYGGNFAIDNSGAAGAMTSTVTIDAGSYYAYVFYVSPTSQTITTQNATTNGTEYFQTSLHPLASATVTGVTNNQSGGNVYGTQAITFTVTGTGGAVAGVPVVMNAIYGSGTGAFVIASSGTGTGSSSVSETTNSTGQVTVYLANSTVGDTGTVEALVSGTAGGTISSTTGTLTVVAGPLSSVALGAFTESGTTPPYAYTASVTLTDANGNGITGVTAPTVTDATTKVALTAGTAAGDYQWTANGNGQYTLVIYESTSNNTDSITVGATANGGTVTSSSVGL